MTKEKCSNCKFAGKSFKWVGMTHHSCEHPSNEQLIEDGKDPRDFIVCWYDTCEKHEGKQNTNQ